ncbi:ATP-binding protein [Piscinibacter sp.]|uniref:ATP-binding protein n=1 Tax=Piscinibacter sp. TaxID=1903157 RepID=UPI00355AC4A0
MKRWWSDTLFKRLFALMWVALVVSHLCAYVVVRGLNPPPPHTDSRGEPPLPPLMSLPPGGPLAGAPPGPPPEGPQAAGALPPNALWLDYLVRFIVIGAAAWLGARWLSAPMRRLAAASEALSQTVGQRQLAPQLDERRGTLEVRQTAHIFNAMSQRLHEQFDAQRLLMAAISHDLRTPLARMRLRLEQLGDHAQAQRCVDDVQEMDSLIGSVLGMMRDSHVPAARQRIDVLALVQSLADDLSEQGQQVRVLGRTGDPGPLVVHAHAAALQRVIGNLVGNALRYGGSADVSVSARHGQVQVCVDDRGQGIPEHELRAVFQPFYRVASASASAPGGSGLGLYIARDLAERNDGKLSLCNRAEGGLRAELVLPRA